MIFLQFSVFLITTSPLHVASFLASTPGLLTTRASVAPAFAKPSPENSNIINGLQPSMSTTDTDESTLVGSLKTLLESLADGPNAGQRLVDASSSSWRNAIFKTLGAPTSADPTLVATALETAMARPDNQFAILMGQAEPFEANFPSDPTIDMEDGTAWVECRLRHRETDKLLVTMGVNLVLEEVSEVSSGGSSRWLISGLDWQDFREAFYPGQSGREWLRAF